VIGEALIALSILAGALRHVDQPAVTAVRGITGSVEFTSAAAEIRARPNQSLSSPVLVRVAEATSGGGGGPDQTSYRIEFIGLVAGDIDLRDYLERADGSIADIPPLSVRIVSQLPPDHGTDLFSGDSAPSLPPTGYRSLLLAIGAAWAAVPIVYLVVRQVRRKPPPPPPPPERTPTLADQLRPLAEAARDGTLSVSDRGRLELLLYHYWRSRLNLQGPQAAVIAQLRLHERAGELLRGVERCIHAPPSSPRLSDQELGELLEPYRHAPAIEETAAAPGGAPGRAPLEGAPA
jgi:hypothetical protein